MVEAKLNADQTLLYSTNAETEPVNERENVHGGVRAFDILKSEATGNGLEKCTA